MKFKNEGRDVLGDVLLDRTRQATGISGAGQPWALPQLIAQVQAGEAKEHVRDAFGQTEEEWRKQHANHGQE